VAACRTGLRSGPGYTFRRMAAHSLAIVRRCYFTPRLARAPWAHGGGGGAGGGGVEGGVVPECRRRVHCKSEGPLSGSLPEQAGT
jgi:hypothetical protein